MHDKPIIESVYECKDILMFCKTQNIGKKYIASYFDKEEHNMQLNVRFYTYNRGGYLFKNEQSGKLNNLCAGYKVIILNTLDDIPIELRDINYNYYYHEAMKIINPINLGIPPQQKVMLYLVKNLIKH